MENLHGFSEQVWAYYRDHGRHDLPWRQPEPAASGGRHHSHRHFFDAYKIMVSELMLQQTQVSRVIPKYQQFIAQFPTVAALADAPLAAVLQAWSGLGYNRRAKFLWQAAARIQQDFAGQVPDTRVALVSLPGIGANTAGAMLAYAYNQPVVFLETNIRTVFIHHFFADAAEVHDAELLPFVQQAAIDNVDAPRDWYWALMDYGTYLKQTTGNAARASKTYTKQSAFQGSRRQIRGQVLRELAAGPQTLVAMQRCISDERLVAVLDDLVGEGLVECWAAIYRLPGGMALG
jgi:A/G-specific adenine glycosylase